MTIALERDQIWAAIDEQRRRVVDLLEQLTDDEWRSPSLCAGWTVRDVAAHLTRQEARWRDVLPLMVRFRGNIDRAIHESAREDAVRLSTAQIIAAIRGTVGSRRHNVGVSYRETLIDAVIHSQDIALPLGRPLETPATAAAEVATRLWTMRFPPPFPATRAMKEFRIIATDIDWSVGRGAEVHGPIAAIMLVGAGRLVALPQLTGPGAADLAARLRVG
jgi:uncharacterized protein (TIGR03083 family)